MNYNNSNLTQSSLEKPMVRKLFKRLMKEAGMTKPQVDESDIAANVLARKPSATDPIEDHIAWESLYGDIDNLKNSQMQAACSHCKAYHL